MKKQDKIKKKKKNKINHRNWKKLNLKDKFIYVIINIQYKY